MSDSGRQPRSSEQGTEGHTVSLDDVFGTLAAQRRRVAVRTLADCEGAMPVGELVTRVVEREADLCAAPPQNHAERVAAALRHTHLPKLAALGLVEYDRRSDTVRFEKHAAVEEWLDHAAALSLPGSI